MKILCAADIHLGRQPSIRAFPGQPMGPGAAWEFVVASALRERADLVLLAGDLVERDNRYFEAWAPLRAGVLRLLEAGMTVAAVAGNHDSEALPRLHDDLARDLEPAAAARFLLLGRRDGALGVWTQAVVTRGADALRLVGWSFPAPQHSADPFRGFPAVPGDLPTLGLLHGDLDQPGSPYAPFTTGSLQASRLDRWVLGHVHAPSARDRAPFYCGSPLPLRAGETGAHGCWTLTLDGRAWSGPVAVPAPVRIEPLAVPLGAAHTSEAEVQAAILQGMRATIRACREGSPALAGVLFRVRLTGETRLALPARPAEELATVIDQVHAAVHGELENLTRPPHSLEQWAADPGARGILARLIQDLERGAEPLELPEPWRDLLDEILRLEAASRCTGAYAALDPRWMDASTADPRWPRALLLRACLRLFTGMLPAGGAG